MFCVQCGNKINESERVCTQCGAKAAEPPAETAGSNAVAASSALDSSALATPAPAAPARAAAPAPPFRLFGVEMGEQPATVPVEDPAEAPDFETPATSGGLGASFWMATCLVVLAGVAVIAAWMLISSRASGISVKVEPATVHLQSGANVALSATVTGDRDNAVNWTIVEGGGAGFIRSTGVTANGSKVAASAEYTAPLKAGTYHVLATSLKDQKQASSAEIVVGP